MSAIHEASLEKEGGWKTGRQRTHSHWSLPSSSCAPGLRLSSYSSCCSFDPPLRAGTGVASNEGRHWGIITCLRSKWDAFLFLELFFSSFLFEELTTRGRKAGQTNKQNPSQSRIAGSNSLETMDRGTRQRSPAPNTPRQEDYQAPNVTIFFFNSLCVTD